MLFHMYLTPVILIPVTKQQNKNTNKQTLHINQRTLKPLAYTATHSHKHVQYTQQQKISTTKQQSNKQNKSATNERTHTYTHTTAYNTHIHKKQQRSNMYTTT